MSDGRCGSIGYGIATAYAKEGANLVITGRNVAKLEKAVTENAWAFDVEAKPNDGDPDAKKLTGITPVPKDGKPGDDASGSQGASAAARFLASITPQSN